MANEDRVKLSVFVGDSSFSLITSRIKAEEFRNSWESEVSKLFLTITGIIDHCDGNAVEYSFAKEEIKAIQILEINRL
jgi:hypothetical protein